MMTLRTVGFSLLLVSLRSLSAVSAVCESELTLEMYSSLKSLTFIGFEPTVNRFDSRGMGHKIILKDFSVVPVLDVMAETISVTAGDSCDGVSSDPAPTTPTTVTTSGALLGAGLGLASRNAFLTMATILLASASMTSAEDPCVTQSLVAPITVEIYIDLDKLIMDETVKMECPPESTYWEHHPTVFGGYSGCVGEKYLLPCPQDAQGANIDTLYEKTPINWNGNSCEETGYDWYDRTFWILWGDPLDKAELLERTGLNPVVKFPLERGPYPSYSYGEDETTYEYDDSNTAKAVAKDFLVYLGAITEAEKDSWYVTMTEGAENGISILWAAKALEIARTTCNREIYVLMEAPAYGYDNGVIATWVNEYADSFYVGEECLCYANNECTSPDVTISNVGFFPPNIPSRVGGDNNTYVATSTSSASPWFESMVFPENPSGRIKIPQLPTNRRVCDGVYVWPMYFYMEDFVVPLDKRPDCSGWAYAITKGYSASVRAGFDVYLKEPAEWVEAVGDIAGPLNTLSYGSYSEWSWSGQMQLQKLFMERDVDAPDSWTGAYSEIMKVKWDTIQDAFEDCPVLELTNYGAGAYAFFVYKDPYLGLQSSSISSFFLDVLGVQATTYSWGFRGADPSEYYGEGVTTRDFTRMQLYRDLNIYTEVGRRAKIVCADTTANIGDFVSIDDWAAIHAPASRHLEASTRRLTKKTRRELLAAEMPHLNDEQVARVVDNIGMRAEMEEKTERCAPLYTQACLFQQMGSRFQKDY